MTKLRGAAVGAGYFSQFHYDAWSRIETVDMLAVCDLDRSQAGRGVRREKRVAGSGCQYDHASFLEVPNGTATDVVLADLVNLDG